MADAPVLRMKSADCVLVLATRVAGVVVLSAQYTDVGLTDRFEIDQRRLTLAAAGKPGR
jgi:hypothetical protein